MKQGDWEYLALENSSLITYQLTIQLSCNQTIVVGKLGEYMFPAGQYFYTGSARKNLIARVRRHLSREKKLRWHIDYLLASPHARVVDVLLMSEPECACNQKITGEIIVPGFGASDCQAGCSSHLKYFADV